MNTNAFQQHALADPWDRDADFLAALDQDPRRREFLDEIQAFDRSLKSALHVDIPEGLAERIKARRPKASAPAPTMRTQRRRVWRYALAAILVLSVGLAGFLGLDLYKSEHRLERLQTAVLRHSYHEPESWTNRETVAGRIVKATFHGFGMDTVREIERVTHAARCRLDDHDGVHLVVWENGRPITVYYLYREVSRQESTMRDRRFFGVIMPGDGAGSWAAVVEADTPIEDARKALTKVRSAVQLRL